MNTGKLNRIDILSIRLAVRCLQSTSLTQAATEEHIAVGAASRRLQTLEAAVGSKLFERGAKGLAPTLSGKVFFKHAIDLLRSVDGAATELRDLTTGTRRHIRLCASSAAIDQFLPQLLSKYRLMRPEIRIELEEQVSSAVSKAVVDGRADLGVFVYAGGVAGLSTTRLCGDELVLALPRSHPMAGSRDAIGFTELLDEDWISLTEGASMLGLQQQAALSVNKPFNIRMQVRSLDVVCNLVSAGLGVALVPKGVVVPIQRSLQLAWRPIADSWSKRTLVIGLREDSVDPELVAFAQFLATADRSQTANVVRQK